MEILTNWLIVLHSISLSWWLWSALSTTRDHGTCSFLLTTAMCVHCKLSAAHYIYLHVKEVPLQYGAGVCVSHTFLISIKILRNTEIAETFVSLLCSVLKTCEYIHTLLIVTLKFQPVKLSSDDGLAG
uniref:Secreted protein n=1 Tax=Octopus bimaculoides TaxID=37653 RepID=A0A0L8G6S7_OCTBM